MDKDVMNYRGCTIKIVQDEDAQSPDDWGNDDAFLVYDHRNFSVGREGFDPREIFESCSERKRMFYEGYYVFTCYAYIHSGVSLSLQRNNVGWWHGNWDTSSTGFVLVKRSKENKWWHKCKAREVAQATVDEWNEYLSGNVYGFQTFDAEGNDIDSCWGFYGDPDGDVLAEAKGSIDCHIRGELKARINLIKTWIRNRVPLYVRAQEPFKYSLV